MLTNHFLKSLYKGVQSRLFCRDAPIGPQRENSKILTDANWRQVQAQEKEHLEVCPAYPEMIELELTKACNFSCTHCGTHGAADIHKKRNDAPQMNQKLLDKLAREAFPHIRRVSLIGEGEPFMASRPLLFSLVNHLYKTFTYLDASTNGALLDDALLDAMAPVLGNICFSLDAATPETFLKIKRSTKFAGVVQTIKKLVAIKEQLPPESFKYQIQLAFALRKQNADELIDFLKMAAQLNVDVVYVRHLLVHFPSMQSETLVDKPELSNPLIEKATKEAEQLGLTAFLPARIACDATPSSDCATHLSESVAALEKQNSNNQNQARPKVNCCFLWRSLAVRSNGLVYPCGSLKPPVVGNLRNNTLDEVWNGSIMREMRKRLDSKDPFPTCRHCWYREVSYFDSLNTENGNTVEGVVKTSTKKYDVDSFTTLES